ncbi:aldose 1-epimerase [Parapedobacter composti]|uniref:Aldose 1-epimerase n=2 Tax=Parapedobacter composti TaxID=623281 RepID=A0A1I1EKS1_9SPHI|nr:aldose 1-epimerase [Parapedobacter composti]
MLILHLDKSGRGPIIYLYLRCSWRNLKIMIKTIINTAVVGAISMLLFAACGQRNTTTAFTKSGLDRRNFQRVIDGDSTDLFVLTNAAGMEVCITNYGGRIVSMMVPDAEGEFRDVVLGFDNIDEYTSRPSSFGATIGRFANRIKHGRFVLGSDTVRLDVNSGIHTIHGGSEGWQYQVFDAVQPDDSTLVLAYLSPDGEGGFPGEVNVEVTLSLGHRNELAIDYRASTTKTTVMNMTNHSFFNLSGDAGNTILNDILFVNADGFTPLDSTLVPTGEITPVKGTPFDFTKPLAIGEGMARDTLHEQLRVAGGIDHNFVLNTRHDPLVPAARLYSPRSGIVMEVYTTEPGLQVYTGNMLDGSRIGKRQQPYDKQVAVCLEAQHFPDSPNNPQFPSTVIEPGTPYRSSCTYRFLTER